MTLLPFPRGNPISGGEGGGGNNYVSNIRPRSPNNKFTFAAGAAPRRKNRPACKAVIIIHNGSCGALHLRPDLQILLYQMSHFNHKKCRIIEFLVELQVALGLGDCT